jgi:hypothetical protein
MRLTRPSMLCLISQQEGVAPTPGFHCHESRDHLEFYIFDPKQVSQQLRLRSQFPFEFLCYRGAVLVCDAPHVLCNRPVAIQTEMQLVASLCSSLHR